MATSTVNYYALSSGLELDEIELSNPYPRIEKIAIKTENLDRISVIFTLSDVRTKNEAGRICREQLNVLLDRLAIEFDIPIEEPQCSGMSLPIDELGKKHAVISSHTAVYDLIGGPIRPGQKRIESLVQKLQSDAPPRDRYFSLYRFSAKQEDPIARFMFLYNILLQLKGDSQKHVDNYIKTCVCEVPKSPRPDNAKILETIYTRLRNEVAHYRNDVIPEHTAKEIRSNVPAFQSIVRNAVMGRRHGSHA